MGLGSDAVTWRQTLSLCEAVTVSAYNNVFWNKVFGDVVACFTTKEKHVRRLAGEVATISAFYIFLSHVQKPVLSAMERCWRAVEPQKTNPHFVLLFTISGFRTPRSPWGYTRYPDGKTPAPLRACLLPGPLEYTTSSSPSTLSSETSKTNWEPTGARHLLIGCSLALF